MAERYAAPLIAVKSGDSQYWKFVFIESPTDAISLTEGKDCFSEKVRNIFRHNSIEEFLSEENKKRFSVYSGRSTYTLSCLEEISYYFGIDIRGDNIDERSIFLRNTKI